MFDDITEDMDANKSHWIATKSYSHSSATNRQKTKHMKKIFGSTAVLNTMIGEVGNKILNASKYIAAPKFNKFAAEIFDTKIKQANLAANDNFDDKLIGFNKKIYIK